MDTGPSTTEDLRKEVERLLIENECVDLARSYIIGCYKEESKRHKEELDNNILGILNSGNYAVLTENANKDGTELSTQRDLMAGEISKDLASRFIFPEECIEAHRRGVIHIHDLDYAVMTMTNCHLCNLEDMLQNGTRMNGVKIEKPRSLRTAATIMTQIALAISSSQYGGQTMSLAHIAPFVDISRKKIKEKYKEEFGLGQELYNLDAIVEKELDCEIKDSVQTINYQLNSTMSSNGQSPFITLFMCLDECHNDQERDDLANIIREVLKQRIQGFKNKDGYWVTPTFPKLVLCLDDYIMDEDGPYHDIFELASECIAKRMSPDLMSAPIAKRTKNTGAWADMQLKDVPVVPPMGCRSFLQPYNDKYGMPKYYGRFNLGVVSMNLPYIAYESRGDIDEFFNLLDHYAELAFKAQMARVRNLKGAKSDVAPILWQDGSIARLNEGDSIEQLFYNDYASISLGFMGVSEAVQYITGLSHTDPKVESLSNEILDRLNQYCADWKAKTKLGFSLYGTPGESLTDKFAKAIQRDFDPGFKGWVTNSYHVPVDEKIDAFTKLEVEAPLLSKTPGGAISYIEVGDLTKNPEAIQQVMRYIYEHVWYAEINTRSSDVCGACGYEGEIGLEERNGKFYWVCPQCGESSENGSGKPSRLSIVRRLCGYCGDVANGVNDGRLSDIKNRVLHL